MTPAPTVTIDSFGHWQDTLDATYVRLAADRTDSGPFTGRIDNAHCGAITLSTMASSSQRVRRTRSLIRQGGDEYLLATILLDGSGRIEQDDRRALLATGTIVFYDSGRPYTLEADGPFRQLVVRVPKQLLPGLDTRRCTARPLGKHTPGAVVASFLTSLSITTAAARDETLAPFATHAAALIATAATFAGRDDRAATSHPVLERILEHLHCHFVDPQLDVAAVAAACHLSRRSVYRALGEGGVAAALRGIRIDKARQLLLIAPERSIGAVASACGYASESGFHRAFRHATGQTPGDYRSTFAGHTGSAAPARPVSHSRSAPAIVSTSARIIPPVAERA
jgi:AraC-like DNA-binding protein